MKKNLFRLALMLVIVVSVLFTAVAEPVCANVSDIAKYGNLILNINGEVLFKKGFEYGDLLEITVLDKVYEVPLCSNYSDVDTGMPVLRVTSAEEACVLAINMGDFATDAGIAVKSKIDAEPGYLWDYLAEKPVGVLIAMKTEDGYREQWLIHQLIRTNERTDYAHLSDEAFANFRAINTNGMGENILYRSSSPINPEIGRDTYAESAAEKAGIATIINLADASNTYEGADNGFYSSCKVVYLNLGLDFTSEDFKNSLAKGLRFMIEGEAPYLLHCNEGKDRAGFASAMLECLMGASIDEVIEDYMESYVNYYGVEKGSEKYNAVVESNIVKTLNEAFRVENVYEANLSKEAEEFLTEDLGLSPEEVSALKNVLGE